MIHSTQMTDDYKDFWKKYGDFDRKHKTLEKNDSNYETLITLIRTKFNLDSYKLHTKYDNWFVNDCLDKINHILFKNPKLELYFEGPDSKYKECLKDKELRKKELYKILNSI